jgi:hypothetical protein
MSPAPLCRNCRHFRQSPPLFHLSGAACTRRKGWDAVQGDFSIVADAFAERRRPGAIFNRDRCGPEGRYFEAAPPQSPPCVGSGGRV